MGIWDNGNIAWKNLWVTTICWKTGSEAAPDKLSGDQDMPAGETGEGMIGSIPGHDFYMGTKRLFHQAWVPLKDFMGRRRHIKPY